MLNAATAKILSVYQNTWGAGFFSYPTYSHEEEKKICEKFLTFVVSHPRVFERDHLPGHFTASALVTDKTFQQVLLTHHAKLNLWLQLGGHAESNPVLHAVARQEVMEESGLQNFHFLTYEKLLPKNFAAGLDSPLPYDLDCHLIPERKTDPAHYHYDVRYLIVADNTDPVLVSEESHDVKWFTLEQAKKVTDERSMHRQFYKLEHLAKILS